MTVQNSGIEYTGAPSLPLIGDSLQMRRVRQKAYAAARAHEITLLLGETGTGKEVVARYIHQNSPRAASPYVAVNCGGLPDSLIESELFGAARGAFTGANADRKGAFMRADKGTLLLDEIAELPIISQASLLRVLQDFDVLPLGSSKAYRSDVKIIAATNKDLAQRVCAQQFREDLFYRLNVFPIAIPPLREHREDIPALVDHYRQVNARKYGIAFSFDDSAVQLLQQQEWRGNVRELSHTISRAAIATKFEGQTSSYGEMTVRELLDKHGSEAQKDAAQPTRANVVMPPEGGSLSMADYRRILYSATIKEIEETVIRARVEKGLSVAQLAGSLRMSWPTIRRRMAALGLSEFVRSPRRTSTGHPADRKDQ